MLALGGLRVNGFSDITGNVGVGGSLNISSSGLLRLSGQITCPNYTNGGKLTADAGGNVYCSNDLDTGVT